MQYCLKSCLHENRGNFGRLIIHRSFTSSQLQTALRPFFFLCHPDLFGKFPEQRAINENSLKVLSAHLEALQRQYYPQASPPSLPFYLRSKDTSNPFRLVKVPLHNEKTTKSFVTQILQTCDLETTYVEKINSELKSPKRSTYSDYRQQHNNGVKYTVDNNEGQFSEEYDIFQIRVRKAKENENLEVFVRKNMDLAHIRTKALDDLREEVEKLRIKLENKLGLQQILYDCGWNYEHFRGCLKSLEKLYDLYGDDMTYLHNKTVIFSQFTGVGIDGQIHLYTGDVQNNWLDLIKHIPRQEVYLSTIPMYENTLSQVLLNIKIARRKFMPSTLAKNYSSHLSRVITNVLDYLSKNRYPETWPESLADYELVVESESGPLMISPTGQLITPSTCPGFLLVDFITRNMEEATIKKVAYDKNKYIEKDLHKACIENLRLNTLIKDDSISPDMMIDCMQRLLKIGNSKLKVNNLNINVTNYYSILSDGTVCIPWNFKNE
ncbi:unnamed protein product [Chironomus riparius]|uniref:T-cell activation inhibitor, mitochondrial n=1 Tax=Chironomus riparius TaxID=315576 RepID=A0A9P0IHT1_9DIPT|nr:unnamed protein product [Chironomus riparius]